MVLGGVGAGKASSSIVSRFSPKSALTPLPRPCETASGSDGVRHANAKEQMDHNTLLAYVAYFSYGPVGVYRAMKSPGPGCGNHSKPDFKKRKSMKSVKN